MKVLIFGEKRKDVEKTVAGMGFKVVENKPDLILSYGGDGTMMLAESKFPGIPKVILKKDGSICKKCSPLSNGEVLTRIRKGSYKIEKLWKLKATIAGKTILGMNDIIIHNKDARHAIRYKVWVNNKEISSTIIGDGIVVATPFGSTAYYRSITDSFFEIGMGLAFNNSTEQADHIVLKEDSEIKIKIIRGPVIIYADNQPEFIDAEEGDEIKIKKSNIVAKILKVN
jgi:NAD+ kinase